jgi:enterochelin esterase-like enzyme/outer membrane protein assembly factor BamB
MQGIACFVALRIHVERDRTSGEKSLMYRRTRWICLGLASVLSVLPSAAHASDWDRWLGPNRDGTSLGNDLFPAEGFGLEVAWNRPLGASYSGIAVAKGQAVTMFADGEFDWLTAVDAKTGEERWRYKIDTMYAAHDGSEGGPVSMPVVDDGVVYALGAKGHLFAVRLEDGREIWSLRIDERLGARAPSYGFTTTPLIVDDLLFLQSGGTEGRSLAGFDKHTGEIRWSTGDDPVGYQSPLLATLAGREQIVAVTNRRVVGLAPGSGEVLWSHDLAMAEGEDGYATPLLLGEDRFLLTGQPDSKAYRLRKAESGFELDELWTSTDLKQSLATPVLYEEHLYGFSGEFLTCVDPSNGEKVWKSRPPGGRGLILVDGHLIVFANDGSVVVVQASPEEYREEARVKVSEAGTYTYPSYADGLFFVRNTADIAGVAVGAAPQAEPAVAEVSAPRNDFDRFVRRVERADDKRLLVDDFMASQPGFPVVEDDRWVHFLYRGDADDVAVMGSMLEYQVEEPLQRIEGTDLYYRSYPIEPGARWEYRLNVDFDNPQPDPLNPRRVADTEGDLSEVMTGGWKQPGYLRPYEGGRPGRVETFTHASEILGNEREIDVYLPAGYDEGGERRYPLLLTNNGKEWLAKAHLANTMDHLSGRAIAPVIVAFVELPHASARDEFGGERSADHVRMLAEEIVPRLDEKYRTLAEPGARGIIGIGAGALMAAYAAVERPDVFGKAGGCSFYLPNPEAPMLMDAIAKSEGRDKPRFWVLWNRYEVRRAEWNVDLARDSRRVAEALEEQGFSVASREVLDSAGWGGWRVTVGEVLEQMFPK